jgi:hypothetical protein
MDALIVFESMFGNTRAIAERIADGLRPELEVQVVPVKEATAAMLEAADLVVCGGPTHVHGLSSTRTRGAAVATAERPDASIVLDPAADGPGLRELFDQLARGDHGVAAAFDTRIDGPAVLTGRASRAIARHLRDRGFRLVVAPESFLVDKETRLVPGETDRAVAWGRALAAAVVGVRRVAG